ncbi:MAG: YbjQ family protein [Bacillota bacterium]
MILVNIDHVPNKKVIKTLGIVKGSTVHSKHLGKDIMAGLRTLVGGEIEEYTQMLDEARKIAVSRMVKNAEELGANAILNIRFASASVMQSAAEIMAYGTAVVIEE